MNTILTYTAAHHYHNVPGLHLFMFTGYTSNFQGHFSQGTAEYQGFACETVVKKLPAPHIGYTGLIAALDYTAVNPLPDPVGMEQARRDCFCGQWIAQTVAPDIGGQPGPHTGAKRIAAAPASGILPIRGDDFRPFGLITLLNMFYLGGQITLLSLGAVE